MDNRLYQPGSNKCIVYFSDKKRGKQGCNALSSVLFCLYCVDVLSEEGVCCAMCMANKTRFVKAKAKDLQLTDQVVFSLPKHQHLSGFKFNSTRAHTPPQMALHCPLGASAGPWGAEGSLLKIPASHGHSSHKQSALLSKLWVLFLCCFFFNHNIHFLALSLYFSNIYMSYSFFFLIYCTVDMPQVLCRMSNKGNLNMTLTNDTVSLGNGYSDCIAWQMTTYHNVKVLISLQEITYGCKAEGEWFDFARR